MCACHLVCESKLGSSAALHFSSSPFGCCKNTLIWTHTHTVTHKYPKIKSFKFTPGDSVPLCINIHWQNNENPVSPCSGNQFNHCSLKSAWVLPSQKDFSKPIEFPIAQQLKQFNYVQLSQISPKHPKGENWPIHVLLHVQVLIPIRSYYNYSHV